MKILKRIVDVSLAINKSMSVNRFSITISVALTSSQTRLTRVSVYRNTISCVTRKLINYKGTIRFSLICHIATQPSGILAHKSKLK